MELTEAEAAVCAAIVAAPEAWSKWDDLERDHGPAILGRLETDLRVVVAWVRPAYVAVTLTPYGAWLLGVEIDEAWRQGFEADEGDDADRADRPALAGARPVKYRRVQVETPRWTSAKVWDQGKPVRLPRHARIGSTLVAPERIAAPPEPTPEFLMDEAGEPVVVLGRPVRADGRWGRGGLGRKVG